MGIRVKQKGGLLASKNVVQMETHVLLIVIVPQSYLSAIMEIVQFAKSANIAMMVLMEHAEPVEQDFQQMKKVPVKMMKIMSNGTAKLVKLMMVLPTVNGLTNLMLTEGVYQM